MTLDTAQKNEVSYHKIAKAASSVTELHQLMKKSKAAKEDVDAVLWHACKLWELAIEYVDEREGA